MGFIISDRERLWPAGEIPYVIRAGAITAFTSQVINHWNAQVGNHIRLIPRTGQSDYVSLASTTTGHSISSGAGKTGGEQNITINPARVMGLTNVDNTSELVAGVILHELGHAAGLLHEHQRHDRDSFVSIQWQNIPPNRCADFWSTASYNTSHCNAISRNKVQRYSQARCVGSYDYLSVMHYLSTHAHRSVNNRSPHNGIPPDRTITRNGISPARYNDSNFEPFGGSLRAILSEGDKSALKTLYPLMNWHAITHGNQVLGTTAQQYPLGLTVVTKR